jgi:flagellin
VPRGTFSINGIKVGAIAGTNGTTAVARRPRCQHRSRGAINAIATQTGVTASANATDGKLTLTAADGRDISLTANGG